MFYPSPHFISVCLTAQKIILKDKEKFHVRLLFHLLQLIYSSDNSDRHLEKKKKKKKNNKNKKNKKSNKYKSKNKNKKQKKKMNNNNNKNKNKKKKKK